METVKIQINEDQLREVLKREVTNIHKFDWTGWRIPIYIENDESITSGGFLSNNSWQPDAHELPVKVETWSMSDYGYDGEYIENGVEDYYNNNGDWDDYDFEEVVDERVDFIIDQFKEYDGMDGNEYELV